MWRRRLSFSQATPDYILRFSLYFMLAAAAIVVGATSLSSIMLGDLPDFKWFMVTIALTLPFLLFSAVVLRGTSITRASAMAVVLIFLLAVPDTQRVEGQRQWVRGQEVELAGSGQVLFGPSAADPASSDFRPVSGSIRISATDWNSNLCPLTPYDRVAVDASINTGERVYQLRVRQPMPDDPQHRFSTWRGVGIRPAEQPAGIPGEESPSLSDAELAIYGLGDLTSEGRVLAKDVPVRLIASRTGLADGNGLQLDIDHEAFASADGPAEGVKMRIYWQDYKGEVPPNANPVRYLGGGSVLLAMLGAIISMNRHERRRR
jgi:hypothetical protein